MTVAHPINQRQFERFALAPMYTAIEVTTANGDLVEGHAYDISVAGARMELDRVLAPGEDVTAIVSLPGWTGPIHVCGSIVWVNDGDDDPAARRMAMRFTSFESSDDLARLVNFLGSGMVYRAA
jgi:hypothetical protein